MKVATWNVNGIRARLPQLLDWLDSVQPDVVALQETKVRDDLFPHEALAEAGYVAACAGQPSYNGVATCVRGTETPDVLATDLPGLDDEARRVLVTESDALVLANLYVPNGRAVDDPAYDYKLAWLEALAAYLPSLLARAGARPLLVVGDFNIAPTDLDVHDPTAWADKILCSAPERAALGALEAQGLRDLFRLHAPDTVAFSWWDYRFQGFRRNRGLRIDLMLGNATAAGRTRSCVVDTAPRALDKPSDHAPVIVTLG